VTSNGRVLALDPGERRVGVAVSNSDRSMAFPRPAINAVVRLIQEDSITHVVIGHPVTLQGAQGASAKGAQELARALSDELEPDAIGVELHDERLTTKQAGAVLRDAGKSTRDQKDLIDSASAAILLEAWLQCR
jgi:putative holliday junction resolvase